MSLTGICIMLMKTVFSKQTFTFIRRKIKVKELFAKQSLKNNIRDRARRTIKIKEATL